MSDSAAAEIVKSPFASQVDNEVHVITTPTVLSKDFEGPLSEEVAKWVAMPEKLHVLSVPGVQEFPQYVIRILLQFTKDLKKAGKHFSMVNVSTGLNGQLMTVGLKASFHVCKDINEARDKAGMKPVGGAQKGSAIDAEFLQPFIKATVTTMETQVSLKVASKKPFVKQKDATKVIDVAGVVNLHADAFKGAIAVCFPEKTFLAVYEKMVGEKHEKINDEVKDAAGELMNIIFGQAKKMLLETKGYKVDKAIPTVLVGKSLEVSFKASNPTIVMPFETDVGEFHIEIIVDKS